MKVVEKIKKGLIGIGTFLLTIPSKVFAVDIGRTVVPMYGVAEPEPAKSVWNICKTLIIPIALLIGIIIYLKKSKSSTKKKILITIGIIAIIVIVYFIVDEIIFELA